MGIFFFQTCDQKSNNPRTEKIPVYMSTKSSMQKLINQVQDHARGCKTRLSIAKIQRRGHVALVQLACKKKGKLNHRFWWSSSPKLPNGKYLVNEKVLHGLMLSGMRPSHYNRFTTTIGLGVIKKSQRRRFLGTHLVHLEEEYKSSTGVALETEIASYEGSNANGIDIISDARHGHRRNAKDTSVVVLGAKTKKVLSHIHITKQRDPVTQRHEKLGVEDFYKFIEDKTAIRYHVHDRNMAVNSFVKKLGGPVNQNDRWHVVKSFKKAIEKVSKGIKRDHGKTWHIQLEDKVEPVGTHAHWAIEHCKGDAQVLCELLSSIPKHYSDDHSSCHETSRCRRDPAYERSRKPVTDAVAMDLLTNAVTKSTLYKFAEDFSHGMSSSHVESFNNIMNMYHDKRIFYSDEEYVARSYIAVLYWNENTGREHNSVWKSTASGASHRGARQRKNYKKATFNFGKNVWDRYISSLTPRQ